MKGFRREEKERYSMLLYFNRINAFQITLGVIVSHHKKKQKKKKKVFPLKNKTVNNNSNNCMSDISFPCYLHCIIFSLGDHIVTYLINIE
jgi:hypothetical protein